MRTDPEGVVDGFYQALIIGDQPAILAYFTDDACFEQHGLPGVPYAGQVSGKENIAAHMAKNYADWDVLKMRPSRPWREGGLVHGSVEFALRLKRTGNVLEGRMRHEFTIADGRIVRLDEYLDAPLLKAFLQLGPDDDGGASS